MRAISIIVFFLLWGCDKPLQKKGKYVKEITDPAQQHSLYNKLVALMPDTTVLPGRHDSLLILVLPIQISCPSCRTKIIRSIVRCQGNLPADRFVILSAKGGYKTINSYFRDEGVSLPSRKHSIVLDSTNNAFWSGLFEDKPVIYFANSGAIVRQVSIVPSTIRKDLVSFFGI